LSQPSFFAGVAERALVFDLKQVIRYFRDDSLRGAANAALGGKRGGIRKPVREPARAGDHLRHTWLSALDPQLHL
jgi:hypothetical protein